MRLRSVQGEAIFVTPVWHAQYEDFEETNRAILQEIDAVDWHESHARRGLLERYERRHREDLFITLEEVPTAAVVLSAFAHNCVQIAEQLGWDLVGHEFRITSFWAHLTPPGKATQLHHHLPSHLSCAYYVAAPEGCGNLRFLDDRKHRVLEPVSMNNHEITRRGVEVKPSEGLMVVFPASVEHQVGENDSSERRVSLSMNADLMRPPGAAEPRSIRVDRTGHLIG